MNIPESIVSAFSEVPYPGDDNIALHECSECRQIRDDFRGQSPQSLGDAILERRFDSLPLLSPAAFRYFIPAFMAFTLSHPDSEVAFFTFEGLRQKDIGGSRLERFRLFTSAQRDLVISFLKGLKSSDIESDDEDRREYEIKVDAAIEMWMSMA